MHVLQRIIQVPGRSAQIRITPLADIHAGTVFCDEALLKEWVKRIAEDEWHFWIGLGDMGEFINRKDPRHRESTLAKWLYGKDDIARVQVEWLLDTLAPIRNRCLALLRGNHEDAILQHYERDVYYDIVNGMKTDPSSRLALGYEGFLRLTLVRGKKDVQSIDFYLHHGYGSGRLPGADALALGRLPMHYDFDVALLGHRHRLHVLPGEVRVGLSSSGPPRLVRRDLRMALCGSFRDELLADTPGESYVTRAGYPPRRTGPLTVEIEAFHGEKRERSIRIIA